MPVLSGQLDVEAVLGANGIIREQIDGFRSRQSQLDMACLIAQAMDRGESKIIEASTGIVKHLPTWYRCF